MNIMPSISKITKSIFESVFEVHESFNLKDSLMLVQGVLVGRGKSINSIATYNLSKVSHTTLTRFLDGHDEFFKDMKKAFERYIMSVNEDTYILDDTQIERRSTKLPFVYKNFDHANGRYVNSQSLLTVGTLVNGEFVPLEMKFVEKGKNKNEEVIQWLKQAEINKGSLVIFDSWYTHSEIIETCKMVLGLEAIGMAKSNLKLKIGDSEKSVGQYQRQVEFTKEMEILSKEVKIHEEIGYFKSIRIPLKVVVCEMNSKRITLVCTDLKMSAEEIVKNYMSRWKIEVFFKSAKQRFNLGDCTLRSSKGQEHWMIIVSVVYLVFKVIMRLLAIRSEEGMKELIHLAISYMISMTNEAKEAYLMLDSGLFSAFVDVGLIP